MMSQIWGKLISLHASTSDLLSFERARICILRYFMSNIVEEIIVGEGQGSRIVGIFDEGPLLPHGVYSTIENVMKSKVVQD